MQKCPSGAIENKGTCPNRFIDREITIPNLSKHHQYDPGQKELPHGPKGIAGSLYEHPCKIAGQDTYNGWQRTGCELLSELYFYLGLTAYHA